MLCDNLWQPMMLCDSLWCIVTTCDSLWWSVTFCNGMWQFVLLYHLGCTRPLVKTFMPQLEIHKYNTRVSIKYKEFLYINKQYALSFYPYFTKLWNKTHKPLQKEWDISEYKIKPKHIYKHRKYKFYYRGLTKRGCTLMTQLWVGRSRWGINKMYFWCYFPNLDH